jgi:hypothetical protein
MNFQKTYKQIVDGKGKINVLSILFHHIQTIKHETSGRASQSDLLIFIYLPVVIALIPIMSELELKVETVNLLITVLSILIGLLLNVLVLLYDLINRNGAIPLKRKLLKEVLHNITFAILLSLTSILFLLASLFLFSRNLFGFFDLESFVDYLIYLFLLEFLVTLLMILKRIHVLLLSEF